MREVELKEALKGGKGIKNWGGERESVNNQISKDNKEGKETKK